MQVAAWPHASSLNEGCKRKFDIKRYAAKWNSNPVDLATAAGAPPPAKKPRLG